MSPTVDGPDNNFGLNSMTTGAPPPGSNGSINQNGAALSQQNTSRQMAARFGGSRKKIKGGATVPPMQVNYSNSGGTQDANTKMTQVNATISANKQFDSQVGAVQDAGGRRKKLNRNGSKKLVGGWPAWGCMSGGKRKSLRYKNRKRLKKSYRRRKSK